MFETLVRIIAFLGTAVFMLSVAHSLEKIATALARLAENGQKVNSPEPPAPTSPT